MSRRKIFSLAASVIIGIACIATISTDAFAYRGGRVGVGRAGVLAPAFIAAVFTAAQLYAVE